MASIEFPLTQNEKNLRDLKNIHYGERCFILGNGPSLLKHDLSILKNEITFGVNSIFLAFENIGFKPNYYVIEDRFPAEDNKNIINQLSGLTKIFPEDLRYCLKKDKDSILINFKRYYADFPNPQFPKFSKNIQKHAFWGGTVSFLNLQLAYYMGFKEVYLIGMDLDYKVPNYAKGNTIKSREDDINHFHPAYFGPGKRWHLPEVDRMVTAFEKAKDAFEEDGRKIINAGIGGNLSTFSRVDFTKLFKKPEV